jgi:eukaryotic-like serine/threonine-protein kinase
MPSEHFPEDPALRLTPGARVGRWRVVERQGHGGCGIVYRAQRVGQEQAGPVALKLARYPWDRRFGREVELLSRLRHPSVPRLLDQGVWRLGSGVEHPYLVMEWVEGPPLYAWAAEHAPSAEQQLRLVAQLASALAATHAARALHRDVKGDNIRVRRTDGRAMLFDFGAAHFQGAARLTWNGLPPGTEAYRSPEAWLFHLNASGKPEACFEATPADDLYALGVTVYRLLTGEYPPGVRSRREPSGAWRLVEEEELRPRLERHARVEPLLREWLLRLLSQSAEERGTAAELAEELEEAAERAAALGGRAVRRAPEPERGPWRSLAAAALGGLLVWAAQGLHGQSGPGPLGLLEACGSGVPEPGTAAVGDTAPSAAPASVQAPAEQEAVAQEAPPQPQPRQVRPDKHGKCPGRKQVAINGACWVEVPSLSAEACAENSLAYYQGRCYAPTLAPREKPLPTSSPANARSALPP